MALDAYSLCPGGTGKKIKHCACRDIAGELEKIARSLEGNQRQAALDRINRALATRANRPCLLAMKAMTLLGMNELQDLEETVATFIQVAPDNPLAYAFAAILEVHKQHVAEAVDRLQSGLSLVKETFPGELYDALGAVAELLAAGNFYVAARGHLLFRAMIGGEAEDAMKPLVAVTSSPNIPRLLKRDLVFVNCPNDVPWKGRFSDAAKKCARGAWKEGHKEFVALDQQFSGQPSILRNIATAKSYLVDPGAADAWHAFAMIDDVPFDEAVAAEAYAQLMDFESNQKTIASTNVTLVVSDANAMMEKLLSSKRIISDPVDPTATGDDDSPPPKGMFRVLSGPQPATDEQLTLDNVPILLAMVCLYGKQTDRNARLELTAAKNQNYDQARALLEEIAGDLIVSQESEEITDAVPMLQLELFPGLQFPDTALITERKKLTDAACGRAVLEKWPTLSLTELDDKSPEQVAEDPSYRVRLAAAILALDQIGELERWPVDANALRERLGLPALEPIDPSEGDESSIGLEDWNRILPEKLTDEQLVRFYQQATMYQATVTLWNLGREMLKRDSLNDQVDKALLCGNLSRLARDTDDALAYLVQARKLAVAADKSPAQFLLGELPLRFLRAEVAEAQQIVALLQTRHLREPGVADSLYQLLVRFGVITPDGGAPARPAATEAPPEQANKIWQPGDPEGPPEEGKQESKLWVPGSD